MRAIEAVVLDGSREAAIGSIAAAETMFRHALSLGFDELRPSRAAKRIDDVIVRLRRRRDAIDLRILTIIEDDCVSETHILVIDEDPSWEQEPTTAHMAHVAAVLQTCTEAMMRPVIPQRPKDMLPHVHAVAAVAESEPRVTRAWLPTPWLALSLETGGKDGTDGLPTAHVPAMVDPVLLRDMDAASPCTIEIVTSEGNIGSEITIRPFALTHDPGIPLGDGHDDDGMRWFDGEGRRIECPNDPVILMRWIAGLRDRMTALA